MSTIGDSLSLDELASGNTRCKVGRLLDKLSDKDSQVVEMALAADREQYRNSRIAAVLSARYERVSDMTVARHRAGTCCCSATSGSASD